MIDDQTSDNNLESFLNESKSEEPQKVETPKKAEKKMRHNIDKSTDESYKTFLSNSKAVKKAGRYLGPGFRVYLETNKLHLKFKSRNEWEKEFDKFTKR